MTAKRPAATVLEADQVRLEPLTPAHVPALFEELDGEAEVFRWLPVPLPPDEAALAALAANLLATPDAQPFAVVLRATGRPVGWTSYLEIVPEHERLEIGWTWYARRHWRSAVNTESKLLLMSHAFDDLGYGRVQWKTDILNTRSQRAIERLGATREGVLRRHRPRPDGTWRDSVVYSLLAPDWPATRAALTAHLQAHS